MSPAIGRQLITVGAGAVHQDTCHSTTTGYNYATCPPIIFGTSAKNVRFGDTTFTSLVVTTL